MIERPTWPIAACDKWPEEDYGENYPVVPTPAVDGLSLLDWAAFFALGVGIGAVIVLVVIPWLAEVLA